MHQAQTRLMRKLAAQRAQTRLRRWHSAQTTVTLLRVSDPVTFLLTGFIKKHPTGSRTVATIMMQTNLGLPHCSPHLPSAYHYMSSTATLCMHTRYDNEFLSTTTCLSLDVRMPGLGGASKAYAWSQARIKRLQALLKGAPRDLEDSAAYHMHGEALDCDNRQAGRCHG